MKYTPAAKNYRRRCEKGAAWPRMAEDLRNLRAHYVWPYTVAKLRQQWRDNDGA